MTPVRATGVDVGAAALYVSVDLQKPAIVDLTDPAWPVHLAQLVSPGDYVALEPTGWAYSAPVIALLQHAGAHVLTVEHRVTGQVRALKISGIKTDKTDARALSWVAQETRRADLKAAEQPGSGDEHLHGVRPTPPAAQLHPVQALRLQMLAHRRASKEMTRTGNRLRQIAHAIWPSLAQALETYLAACRAGYVTPQDLRALAVEIRLGAAPKALNNPMRRRTITAMVDALPTWRDAEELRPMVLAELDALDSAERRAEGLRALIEDTARQHFPAQVQLLSTIPHATALQAAAIIAATKGAGPQLTRSQFRAAFGAFPIKSQSGLSDRDKASRSGFKPAKAIIYLWTMTLIRSHTPNPVQAAFAAAEARRAKKPIAVARGVLLNICSSMLRNGEHYQERRTK
jgi:transposase